MSRKTILFVDDETHLLNGLRRMLHPLRHRWTMHFIESGDKALEIMAAGEVSETLKIVYYPFVYCVAAGFCILTLTCLLDIPRALRRKEAP